jgi:hypothetical protein
MSKHWIMLLTIIFLLPIYDISASEDTVYSQQANDDLSRLCKGDNSSTECAERIENYQFKKGVSDVSRKGKQLIIALKGEKKNIFTDSEPDDSNGRWYRYREYLSSIKYHLIHLQYYEGGGYVLLNANNGKYKVIENIPVISPDKTRIAVISYCDAYCSPGIAIMRITDEDIISEFSLKPEYWASGKLQWVNDNNIKVNIEIPVYDKETKFLKKTFYIYRLKNGWKTKGY